MSTPSDAGPHRYYAYGAVITSDVPLALPVEPRPAIAHVDCRGVTDRAFQKARSAAGFVDAFHRFGILADGSMYLGWDTVGEFLVSADGCEVSCRRADRATWESFQVYMLGQALSFALVLQRIEPLHATTVVVDGEAIAFLGDSGHGKSSLAAAFLHAGQRLLTDDLLVLENGPGGVVAHPGPPRIKLFPAVARRFLRPAASGDRMNAATEKLIVALDKSQYCKAPVKLAAMFALTAPRDVGRLADIIVQPLAPRDRFLRLLRASFNRQLTDPHRLACQFDTMMRLAECVPIERLSYPRSIDRLAAVRATVLKSVGSLAAVS